MPPNQKPPTGDLMFDIPAGRMGQLKSDNKFGLAPNCPPQLCDVWDLAGGNPAQYEWTPPASSQVHHVSSTAPGDAGRTVTVKGLIQWHQEEVTMDVTIPGDTLQFVCIYRMICPGNVGTIRATALGDDRITAQINPGQGQTQMAIYAVPSISAAYLTQYYANSSNNTTDQYNCQVFLRVYPDPKNNPGRFSIRYPVVLQGAGQNGDNHPFRPYRKIPGPAIIKVSCIPSRSGTRVGAGFDFILE